MAFQIDLVFSFFFSTKSLCRIFEMMKLNSIEMKIQYTLWVMALS